MSSLAGGGLAGKLWVGSWIAAEVPGSRVKVSGRKWSPEHTAAAWCPCQQ